MEHNRIYHVYGEECVLTVAVNPEDICTVVFETEYDYAQVEGVELTALVQLLDKIAHGDPDDREFR